jgi:hypothetical protein
LLKRICFLNFVNVQHFFGIEFNACNCSKFKMQIDSIDQHKCIVLLEDGTLSMYDVESGELWYEKKTLVDTAYTTTLHASHQSIYIDGHREGLIRIDSGSRGSGSVKELDDLATWMSSKFSKPATNPFLTALMNTPPYNATHNTQLNWSWPQP